MTCSPHQIACFARRLTLRRAAAAVQRMAGALADAQVDLNLRQVDATLSATSNPIPSGASGVRTTYSIAFAIEAAMSKTDLPAASAHSAVGVRRIGSPRWDT